MDEETEVRLSSRMDNQIHYLKLELAHVARGESRNPAFAFFDMSVKLLRNSKALQI